MQFDPQVMAMVGAEPQQPRLDPDVIALAAKAEEDIEAKRDYLRGAYAWQLAAPLSGTRGVASERATKEVTDPIEQKWLVEEVGKISQAQSWAKEKEYGEAGLPGRLGMRAQQVGGAFAEAGTAMTGALADFRDWMQGRGDTMEKVRFKRQLEAAKQGADPSLGRDAPLSLKAAAGAAGMAPDLSAGLLAGITAGPYAMFAYWTARLFPERNEDYLEMGLSPNVAATAGAVTAAAESAIEMINIDPTGTTKGAIAQPARGLVRRAISETIKKHGGKRLISVMERSPVVRVAIGQALDALERTGVEVAEEGMQRGVRDVGQYLAALSGEEIEGPVFSSIAPAMWEEMKAAAPGIVALGGGAGAGMAIGEATMRRQEEKRTGIEGEILEYADQGKVPSRRKRVEWGLPEEGWESRAQRKEGVQQLAREILAERRVEVATQARVEAPAEMPQESQDDIAWGAEGIVADAADPAVKAARAAPGSVYREVTIQELDELINPNTSSGETFGGVERFWSDNLDLAISQSPESRGLIVEADPTPLALREHAKPGTDIPGVGKEFVSSIRAGQIRPSVKSVTIRSDAVGDKAYMIRVKRFLTSEVQAGRWTKELLPDKSIRYERVGAPVEAPQEAASEAAEGAKEIALDAANPAVKAAGATGGQSSGVARSLALQVKGEVDVRGEGAEGIVAADVVDPVVREAVSALQLKATEAKAVAKDFVSLVSPAHVTTTARRAGHILRRKGAQAAQQTQAARARMGKLEFQFLAMPPEARLEFIDRMEAGTQQATPALTEVATVLREELDSARDRVRGLGKLNEYMDNYFPHLWKHSPDKDAVIASIGGKTFRVSGFLRKRKIPTIKVGIEAGLELITDNPVDLALIRIQQMNEYVAKTQALQVMKATGISKFVPASMDKSFLPSGYEFVNDPSFLVQTSADVTVEEAYDELLREQLESVAHAIGVSHDRVAKLPRGAWGESVTSKGKVRTKFAGPMSVLAHEIGHQIGDKFGLIEYIEQSHPAAGAELVALAQLRYEDQIPDLSYRQYVEEVDEKEAVILEAWLVAPEKMRQVAPHVTEAWTAFLENNEQLRPLAVLNRSLVIGVSEATIEQPGVHVLGRYALPREVATMVNNHLSPGLRRNRNLVIKSGYKLARTVSNAMNQASLSMSFFHALNVMTDASASQHAMGMQQIARGKVVMGLGNVAQALTVVAPGVRALAKGRELVHAMNQDMDTIRNPKLRATLESIITAGGRSFMDQQYHNHAAKALVQSFRDIRYGPVLKKVTASVMVPSRLIFAALEVSVWPTMQYMVPRLKLGVFYYMAGDIYRRAEAEGLSEFEVTEQLSQAWDSVDNRMGQLGYDNLFWNQYLKDASMLALRSVGWNLGSIREFGGGILDIATFRQRMARGDQFLSRKTAYFAGAVITYSQIGAILMYLMTGEWPRELRDYFFPRTGKQNPDGSDERISLPTYAKDWVGWSTDPVKTIRHKMHPIWNTISDMLSNEDYFGTEIRNADDPWIAQLIDTVQHGAESFLPFSVRNYGRMREAGEPIGLAAPLAALGISPAPGYITRTKAQKLAVHYLKERIPAGSRTADEAAAAKYRKNLLKQMRAGEEITLEEMEGVSSKQRAMLAKAAKMTPFQAMFNRLALHEALNVYAVANAEEREQTTRLLGRKYKNAHERTEDEVRLYRELLPE